MTETKKEAGPTAEHARAALAYHEFPTRGKLAITATKPLVNQHDLSLAYSPGVAAASSEIARDPALAERYTARGNLIGVVTNGSAVLGLGNIGPLAAKPVMEGKAVLFKKFAGIDAFDLEIDEKDPDRLIEIIASLAPTFGATKDRLQAFKVAIYSYTAAWLAGAAGRLSMATLGVGTESSTAWIMSEEMACCRRSVSSASTPACTATCLRTPTRSTQASASRASASRTATRCRSPRGVASSRCARASTTRCGRDSCS